MARAAGAGASERGPDYEHPQHRHQRLADQGDRGLHGDRHATPVEGEESGRSAHGSLPRSHPPGRARRARGQLQEHIVKRRRPDVIVLTPISESGSALMRLVSAWQARR